MVMSVEPRPRLRVERSLTAPMMPGRDGVAEGVDDEELAGHGGGADLGTDGVEGGGVDWSGAQEDEEDGCAEAVEGEGVRAEETEQRRWNGERGADGGNEVEGFRVGVGPASARWCRR